VAARGCPELAEGLAGGKGAADVPMPRNPRSGDRSYRRGTHQVYLWALRQPPVFLFDLGDDVMHDFGLFNTG
jgi:hypothetical protein